MSREFKPWETVRFSWGTAIRHRKGEWETLYLHPDAQELDVRNLSVILHDNGIEFMQRGVE